MPTIDLTARYLEQARRAYDHNAEFHARCRLTAQALDLPLDEAFAPTILIAVWIGTMPVHLLLDEPGVDGPYAARVRQLTAARLRFSCPAHVGQVEPCPICAGLIAGGQ